MPRARRLATVAVLGVALLIVAGLPSASRDDTRPWPFARAARHAQVDIAGRVYDETSGAPIEGAFVIVRLMSFKRGPYGLGNTSSCLAGSGVVRTDANGRYRFFLDFEKEGLKIPDDLSPELRVYSPNRRYGDEVGAQFWFLAVQRRDFPLRWSDQAPAARREFITLLLDNSCHSEQRNRSSLVLLGAMLEEVSTAFCTAREGTAAADFSVQAPLFESLALRVVKVRNRLAGTEWSPSEWIDELKRFRQLWHDGPTLRDNLRPPQFSTLAPDKKERLCDELSRRVSEATIP